MAIINAAYNRVTGYLTAHNANTSIIAGAVTGLASYGTVCLLTKTSLTVLAASGWGLIGVVGAVAAKHLYDTYMHPPVQARVPENNQEDAEDAELPGDAASVREQADTAFLGEADDAPLIEPTLADTSQNSVPISKLKRNSDALWNEFIAKKIEANELEAFEKESEALFKEKEGSLHRFHNIRLESYTFQNVYDVSLWSNMVIDFAYDKIDGAKTPTKCWEYCHEHYKEFGEFILKEKLTYAEESEVAPNSTYPVAFIKFEIPGRLQIMQPIIKQEKVTFLKKIQFFTHRIATLLKTV